MGGGVCCWGGHVTGHMAGGGEHCSGSGAFRETNTKMRPSSLQKLKKKKKPKKKKNTHTIFTYFLLFSLQQLKPIT